MLDDGGKKLTSRNLKIIALATMSLDHLGAQLDMEVLRVIGRIAFPLFAFMIAEGMFYSKNKIGYITRLFIFAIISEPFFNLFINSMMGKNYIGFLGMFINPDYQNVYFTLGIGATLCYIFSSSLSVTKKVLLYILACIVGTLLKQDYYLLGSLYIFGLYYYRGDYRKVFFVSIVFLFAIYFSLPYYFLIGALTSLIFIKLYNGEKGGFLNKQYEKIFQIFTYVYYPLHLLLLGIFF